VAADGLKTKMQSIAGLGTTTMTACVQAVCQVVSRFGLLGGDMRARYYHTLKRRRGETTQDDAPNSAAVGRLKRD
jgi:hypothetical protein